MARSLVRWQPPPTPGWGPVSQPTHPRPSTLWPKLAREILIFAVLLAIFARAGVLRSPWGLVAVIIARALLAWIRDHRGELPSTLAKWTAAAVLGAIVATSVPTVPAMPKRKPPTVKVDAAQADQLAEARCGVVNLYAQMARGFPALPDATPCPLPKKPKGIRR